MISRDIALVEPLRADTPHERDAERGAVETRLAAAGDRRCRDGGLIVRYGTSSAPANQSSPARTPKSTRSRSTPKPQPSTPRDRSPAPGLRFVDVPAPDPRPTPQPTRVPAIPLANLTRRATYYPVGDTVFTAVDVETTGLDCDLDRVVEIGLVKFTADGEIIDEFATLVNNPGSSREARDKHQINDEDLTDAPSTVDALHEAFEFMTGTVVVAHNFEFEEGFLSAAARRERIPLPPMVGVCTLQTSRRQLDGRAYSLTVMYKTATGEFPPNSHTALGDARAIREIFLWLLNNSPSPLHLTLSPPSVVSKRNAVECQISCRPVPLSNSSVADLLASFPQSTRARDGDRVEVEAYLALLAESVEDGRLTFEEAQALTLQARRTRLTGTQLREIHRQAWDATFPDAKDATWAGLSPVRRREMYLLADALGLPDLAADIKSVIEACAEPEPAAEARFLRGLRVGIVGDDGESVALRKRADSYGAKLAVNITKTVVWLATTTPDSTDAKHNSARKLGIPMLTPAQASDRLDEAIREAELKAFERQREIDEYAALRQQYQAEREVYWRPTWRPVELERDPVPDFDWY